MAIGNIKTLDVSKIKVIVELIPFWKVVQVKLSKFQERRPSITMYQSVDNQVLTLKIKESQCNVTKKDIERGPHIIIKSTFQLNLMSLIYLYVIIVLSIPTCWPSRNWLRRWSLASCRLDQWWSVMIIYMITDDRTILISDDLGDLQTWSLMIISMISDDQTTLIGCRLGRELISEYLTVLITFADLITVWWSHSFVKWSPKPRTWNLFMIGCLLWWGDMWTIWYFEYWCKGQVKI